MLPAVGDRTTPKRARTGCQKCRIRRRKCDEEKPQCKRCRLGGFECQYGTRLSFRDKNTITLPEPASSGPSAGRSTYRHLKFVEPRVPAPADATASLQTRQATPPRDAEATLDDHRPYPSSIVQEHGFDFGDGGEASSSIFLHSTPSPATGFPPSELPHPLNLLNPVGTHDQSPNTGAYETALDVLLSLGSQENSLQTPSRPERESSQTRKQSLLAEIAAIPEFFATCRHAPQAVSVRLFRHYLYHIAPWLDTGDPNQMFRLRVSQLALKDPKVWDAIFFLSSTSLLLTVRSDHGLFQKLEEMRRGVLPLSASASATERLASVLAHVGNQMITDPLSQQPPPENFLDFNVGKELVAGENIELDLSLAWLVLRLNLVRGLIHNEAVAIPEVLEHSFAQPSPRVLTSDLLSFNCQPLLLCAKALNYCFGRGGGGGGGEGVVVQSKVDNWREIFNSLNLWHANRPQESKPMLEIERRDQLFPLLLFSNRAALMANQMYHTAMALLLQHRPRTLAANVGRSVGTSSLRHVQIVCSISLNSDEQNSWDFCLLASFYLAAKRISYVPQQEAIAAKFEKLVHMTGWNMGTLLPQLKRIWNASQPLHSIR